MANVEHLKAVYEQVTARASLARDFVNSAEAEVARLTAELTSAMRDLVRAERVEEEIGRDQEHAYEALQDAEQAAHEEYLNSREDW